MKLPKIACDSILRGFNVEILDTQSISPQWLRPEAHRFPDSRYRAFVVNLSNEITANLNLTNWYFQCTLVISEFASDQFEG